MVLLLSDVFGHASRATRDLADHIAFACDAVVVAPNLFGEAGPWAAERGPSGGAAYEDWRAAAAAADRVEADVAKAAAWARETYAATALGACGVCFGGGRALELAARAGAGAVDACVALYPTRYCLEDVAGVDVPTLALFGSDDATPGATASDAERLGGAWAAAGYPDAAVRVFEGRGHAFAHRPDAESAGDAEIALLLATAWFDLHLRSGAGKTVGSRQ